jgi:hypothetical protein
MKTMEILGFMYELIAPFLVILTKHINTCYMSVLQVFYDQICLGTLGFEVFEPKTPFLQVLDCPNSPQRAGSLRGELEVRTGGPARPQLATASVYSPPQ